MVCDSLARQAAVHDFIRKDSFLAGLLECFSVQVSSLFMPPIRSYVPSYSIAAADVLTDAFSDDPFYNTLNRRFTAKLTNPQNTLYGDIFVWFLWIYHNSYGMTEVAMADDDTDTILAAALWENERMTVMLIIRFLAFFLWILFKFDYEHFKECLGIFLEVDDLRRKHCPNAHHHLHMIGTHSTSRGKGVGSALIKMGIDRAEKLGVPCYLESTNPRNVPFYKRNGFVIVEEFYPFKTNEAIDGDGPVLTLMRREPTKKKA